MQKSPDRLTLDLSGEPLIIGVTAAQGDIDSRPLEITITDGGEPAHIPTGVKVVLTGQSPSGMQYVNDGVIDGSIVRVTLSEQMLAESGTLTCAVKLIEGGQTITTAVFGVYIVASPYDQTIIEASSEYQTFVHALIDLQSKLDASDAALHEVAQATVSANTAAQTAQDKAAAAQAAAAAANTAKAGADAASDRANTAATGADTAAGSASAAATRANTAAGAAEQVIADVSGELGNIVDTQFAAQKGAPNGIASLNSSGKLVQMPTVADVGALPADAIASGNNSNGNWIKFKGGALLQWGNTAIESIAAGSHATVGFDFPTAFAGKPVVIPMPRIDAAQSLTVHHGNANSNNSGAYCYVHNDSGSTVSGAELGWIAVGSWQ